MKLDPRVRLVLLASLFFLPVAASVVAYVYLRPEPTANYGELLLPPSAITPHAFGRAGGGAFAFAELAGRWVLVAADSGACDARCLAKLTAMRQVRLALGRNATRVARVFVVDDEKAPDAAAMAPFDAMIVATTPSGVRLPPGAANDRARIYLVDPRGNVMMRWPAEPDPRRMLRDLERLLKASQIG